MPFYGSYDALKNHKLLSRLSKKFPMFKTGYAEGGAKLHHILDRVQLEGADFIEGSYYQGSNVVKIIFRSKKIRVR